MAHRIDDRWLWLGAGVGLFMAFKSISYAIHDTVRLTEVEPLTAKQQEANEKRQPEDSLSLDVLRTLATSPNPSISNSAINLIAARCTRSKSVKDTLYADEFSPDPEVRRRANIALRFLAAWIGNRRDHDIGHPVPHTTDSRYLPYTAPASDGEYIYDPGNVPNSGLSNDNPVMLMSDADAASDAAAAAWASWSIAPPGFGQSGQVGGELTEPELRRIRREAMVLQDGVEVFDEDDSDFIPPRQVP